MFLFWCALHFSSQCIYRRKVNYNWGETIHRYKVKLWNPINIYFWYWFFYTLGQRVFGSKKYHFWSHAAPWQMSMNKTRSQPKFVQHFLPNMLVANNWRIVIIILCILSFPTMQSTKNINLKKLTQIIVDTQKTPKKGKN